MSDDHLDVNHKYRGRTWADVFVGSTYILGGFVFLIALGIGAYFLLGELPTWFFVSILMSFIFIPFLQERARDDAELIMVADQPFKLTEYRIGKKVGLDIDGQGVRFQSKSGVYRNLLTSLDLETKRAKGSQFSELTQIDQVRDMTTLTKCVEMLEKVLKESRISAQTVGVEVEKQSIEIVDWALRTIYGAIIPTEISEAFGIDEKEAELIVDDGLEEIMEEVELE
jgi:hypothetical protein